MDEDDYYNYDDNQVFGTDYRHTEQLGQARSDEGEIGDYSFTSMLSKEEAFMKKLKEDSFSLTIRLANEDIRLIEKIIKLDPQLRFKNPLAFLLGYIVINRNKNINKDDVEEMYRLCKEAGKEGVIKQADIIRYARFISKYIKV